MATFDRPILEHVGVGMTAEHFEATVSFYEHVFGLHRVREQPGSIVFLGDGKGGRLELMVKDCGPIATPHHLAFAVALSEFDAMVERVRESGAPLEPLSDNAFGDQAIFFLDPAGNRCQVIARLEALPR